MTDLDKEKLRADRVMRAARNVLIREVGADLKYVSHKPYAGTNEIDHETKARITHAERISKLREKLYKKYRVPEDNTQYVLCAGKCGQQKLKTLMREIHGRLTCNKCG